jgi:hypothetical protein
MPALGDGATEAVEAASGAMATSAGRAPEGATDALDGGTRALDGARERAGELDWEAGTRLQGQSDLARRPDERGDGDVRPIRDPNASRS